MANEGEDGLDPGPRDELVTESLREKLRLIETDRVVQTELDPAEASSRLAQHVKNEIRVVIGDNLSTDEQAAAIEKAIEAIDSEGLDPLARPVRTLDGIKAVSAAGNVVDLPQRPVTPLSQSDLLVNAEGQPNIGSELKAELASAHRVDLICAFVIWSGVRQLRDALKSVIDRGGKVRVITTTYMGATEKYAVDQLHGIGAEVRVALDARTTKLHAKAWLLERDTGPTTAYVGSSNLSHTALFDGLEWNVRLSSSDAEHVIEKVRMTFESHWASEHFETYDPAKNGAHLEKALAQHDRRSLGESSTITFANLEVRPYPHQERMLEKLEFERERRDNHQNLVVAATGTGKTVVAALDYRNLERTLGSRPSLLFVAHREEILQQSMATFRAVMRDGSFGEMHGGGKVASGDHVFAMVQSLGKDRVEEIDPEAFDVVVVDEFHHAAASSYERLLNHLRPEELVGLTATPERLDGRDVTEWFGGRIAVELRLWEAIDQGFLVPFQYFGVADGVDLGQISWSRGSYVTSELSNLYTGDDIRVAKVLQNVDWIIDDPMSMRALGFCVSKEHAHYMAKKFTEAGLESVALTGDDLVEFRRETLTKLARGDIRCVFSVEVLGEGVDVPDVDCLLLLRPTQSATLFSQQLGRGLRWAKNKSHLTVIDFIGQHRKEFRFDQRLSAIVDRRRGSVQEQVEKGFPFLPAGCAIELDRISEEVVLESLREASRHSKPAQLVGELKQAGSETALDQFIENYAHRVEDIYRGQRSWTWFRREAGLATIEPEDTGLEELALRNLSRLTHIDDPDRNGFYRDLLGETSPPELEHLPPQRQRLITMLAWGLGSGRSGRDTVDEFFSDLWKSGAVVEELRQLFGVLDGRASSLVRDPDDPSIPLCPHARYSREEIVAALGFGQGPKPKVTQGGVLWVPEANSDVFFVDLHKSERDYSPTTMYHDYAISRVLFHWESQSRQAPHQPAVQRYINHRDLGTNVLLFVREQKRGELGTRPFTYLGPVDYVSHESEKPVRFRWKLRTPMPADLFESARSVAAA